MTLDDLEPQARNLGLAIRGALHPAAGSDPSLPPDTKTVLLIGPDEPVFWDRFRTSPQFADRQPDAMDRWSKIHCTQLATDWGGTALFPSDGPPFAPFIQWAKQTGQCWSSPVGLLVHSHAGLFISFRAAVALPRRLALPTAPTQVPCTDCAAPCVAACPVGAIAAGQDYDVVTCKSYLRTAEGADCRDRGCRVRRACPVAQDFSRQPQQSAFHMAAFLKN